MATVSLVYNKKGTSAKCVFYGNGGSRFAATRYVSLTKFDDFWEKLQSCQVRTISWALKSGKIRHRTLLIDDTGKNMAASKSLKTDEIATGLIPSFQEILNLPNPI